MLQDNRHLRIIFFSLESINNAGDEIKRVKIEYLNKVSLYLQSARNSVKAKRYCN